MGTDKVIGEKRILFPKYDNHMTIPILTILNSTGLPWGAVRLSEMLKPGMTKSDISVGW